jgi:hypothetical protein
MTTQYINKATLNGTTTVYWTTTGAPDLTGASSGYNPVNLTNIGVDYTASYISSVSSGFVATFNGDLSGVYPNPTVAKINGNPVSAQTLGTSQDGYKLTWSNSDGYYKALPDTDTDPALSGDVTGSETATVVAKIKGNSVATQTLTASQDGYVLTWDNTDGYWYAKQAGGGGAISAIEISFVSTNTSTSSSSFQRMGGRSLDMSKWAATVSGLNRTVSFYADIQKTSGATSAAVQLYDITNNILITNTNLTTTSNSLTTVSTINLTVGSSAGNIRNDSAAQYEVQLKMNGGSGSDAVYLTNARLLISYA